VNYHLGFESLPLLRKVESEKNDLGAAQNDKLICKFNEETLKELCCMNQTQHKLGYTGITF
jgi:hypothetical protein